MIYGIRITTFCIAFVLSVSLAATAGELAIPHKFKNETPANADEVNANFDAVEQAVDDNHEKILTLSGTRSASVTYSAMGFTPVSSTMFMKSILDGSLSLFANVDGGRFIHNVTLRSGVTMTHIRVHIRDESNGAQVIVELKKRGIRQAPVSLARLVANVADGDAPEKVFEADLEPPEIIESGAEPLPAYYIEVFLNGEKVYLYSVTIDYEYTES